MPASRSSSAVRWRGWLDDHPTVFHLDLDRLIQAEMRRLHHGGRNAHRRAITPFLSTCRVMAASPRETFSFIHAASVRPGKDSGSAWRNISLTPNPPTGTLPRGANSCILCVTRISRFTRAMAAIIRSFGPIGVPSAASILCGECAHRSWWLRHQRDSCERIDETSEFLKCLCALLTFERSVEQFGPHHRAKRYTAWCFIGQTNAAPEVLSRKARRRWYRADKSFQRYSLFVIAFKINFRGGHVLEKSRRPAAVFFSPVGDVTATGSNITTRSTSRSAISGAES